ncbi:MAG: hypothetical protein ACI38B_07660 [Bifidobacterium sp.]|uniref:hypothetical protein n=1 Tax=Bifidobacterium sp. TaxID=41200 RepID=UPI003F1147E6
MPRRKLVLLLVEGESDNRLLTPSIARLLRDRPVEGAPFRCDVLPAVIHPEEYREKTGKYPKQDIVETITEFIDGFFDPNHSDYRWSDLSHIVHVVDLDGTFIPDELVRYTAGLPRPIYHRDGIEVSDVRRFMENRMARRASIGRLIDVSHLNHTERPKRREIPYRLFFVGRNLEDAFADEAGSNLTDDDKQRLAYRKAMTFTTNPAVFEQRLITLNNACGSPQDWRDSWRYVMDRGGCHSLERCSNLYWIRDFIASSQVTLTDAPRRKPRKANRA